MMRCVVGRHVLINFHKRPWTFCMHLVHNTAGVARSVPPAKGRTANKVTTACCSSKGVVVVQHAMACQAAFSKLASIA